MTEFSFWTAHGSPIFLKTSVHVYCTHPMHKVIKRKQKRTLKVSLIFIKFLQELKYFLLILFLIYILILCFFLLCCSLCWSSQRSLSRSRTCWTWTWSLLRSIFDGRSWLLRGPWFLSRARRLLGWLSRGHVWLLLRLRGSWLLLYGCCGSLLCWSL